MNNLMLTIIDIFISLVIESVILSGVFMFISNKASEKQQEFLQNEMNNIEKQNKFDFEQLQTEIRAASEACISQVKESQAAQQDSSNMTYTLKELPKWKDNSLMDQLAAYAETQKNN